MIYINLIISEIIACYHYTLCVYFPLILLSKNLHQKQNILASTKVMLFIPADLFMERFANLPEILNVRGPLRCWLPGEPPYFLGWWF